MDNCNPCDQPGAEREFETMSDEFFKAGSANLYNNMKRTADEYQDLSLTQARQNQKHTENLNNLAIQAMQNAIETANMVGKNALETANMVGKQAHRHSDLAIDRQWNVDEQGNMAAIIAAVVAETLSKAGVVSK